MTRAVRFSLIILLLIDRRGEELFRSIKNFNLLKDDRKEKVILIEL
jgi:hypothetical protein